MTVQITHLYSGAVLHTVEAPNLIGADLSDAYLSGANLIGANLRGANLSDASLSGAYRYENEKIEKLTYIDRIGSRGDTLTFFKCTTSVYAETGCFVGTLTQFEAAVRKTHRDNTHAKAYFAAIALANALLS